MKFSSLSWCTLALAAASAFGVACAPGDPAPLANSEDKAAPKVSSKDLKATVAQLNTSATNGVAYMLVDSYNWSVGQGCAACHRGFPLYGAALAYKNGISVNTSHLDGFASYMNGELFRQFPNNGTKAMWVHDAGYHAFIKGTYEFASMTAYNLYRSNAYQAALEQPIKWLLAPVEPANNGSGPWNNRGNGWAQYDGAGGPNATPGTSTWGVTRNASGVWTYTFPNDGKLFAGQTLRFFPNDWGYGAAGVGGSWYEMTGLAAASISYYLSANPPIAQATKNTYIAFRDELLNTLKAGYVRDGSAGATSRLYYLLTAFTAAGITPQSDATVQAIVNKLLSLKPAGVRGWGDTEWGFGDSAIATGQALQSLCQAGVRLDQNPEVRNAIDWLLSQQINSVSSSCYAFNVGNMSGCWTQSGISTADFPSMYASAGLGCYGVLNVTIGAANVAPADPGQAGAAKLAPGAANTQTVTFNVNIFNNGYDINSFNLTASGGFAGNGGTNLSLSAATVNVNPNTTGTSTVTAVFPSNLPLSTQAPITVTIKYTGPNGQVTSNVVVPVNIGSAVDPNQALATTTTFTSSSANITIGQTVTLTATTRANINNALVPGGSVTFSGPGFSQTVPTNGAGVATYSWNTTNASAGLQTISALFGGYNSGVMGSSQYAASSGTVQVTITAPPPPPAPGISGPPNNYTSTNGNVSVTGTSQAGAILTVRTANGGNLGSVTVPAGGSFTVPLNLPPGAYTITAVATNAGGNSPPSTSQTIIIKPLPPVISSPAGGTATANTTNTLTGTGYPGSTVTVVDAGATVGTFTVAANGSWSGNVVLALGSHNLQITQAINGATSDASSLAIGILPPAPTITSPANNAALPNGNNVFTGAGTVGTTINILDGGVSVGSGVVAANGQYNITAPLGYGSHTITATASNAAGPSAPSAAITVRVAPGAPVITTPAAAQSDIIGPITFAGTGVAGATVTIYDNGVQINQQVIAANGSFSYTIAAPTLGGHSLTATQTSNGQTSPASAARVVTVHNDSDGDTVYDEVDNCSSVWNKDQVDRDGDGLGDVCDQAPGQKDSTNQSTSSTDLGVTSFADAGSDDTLLAQNQNNLVTLPAGAWGTRNTLTLVVDTAANPTGNIQLFGKPLPSAPTWTLMTTYDLQLGPTHLVTLANGLQAQVNVVTPRTSLANYAFRYRQVQARVKEADGSITTIPSCNTGTVSANDPRCVSVSNAYQIVEGTNVDQGVKFTFSMKSL